MQKTAVKESKVFEKYRESRVQMGPIGSSFFDNVNESAEGDLSADDSVLEPSRLKKILFPFELILHYKNSCASVVICINKEKLVVSNRYVCFRDEKY